jgi:hypothetical protein
MVNGRKKTESKGYPNKRRSVMKRMVSIMVLVAIVAVGVVSFSGLACADEIKLVGVITMIDCPSKDSKSATVVLKDNKTEKLVTIVVGDEMTLDKFKDHRIVEGDEIRCKYETKDGKNFSTYFKKTAGC